MNKWLVAVISIGITVNANAEVFSMMDQFFEDFEVVDDDYHYVDLNTASIFLIQWIEWLMKKSITSNLSLIWEIKIT